MVDKSCMVRSVHKYRDQQKLVGGLTTYNL
jgi:hypothetical protein